MTPIPRATEINSRHTQVACTNSRLPRCLVPLNYATPPNPNIFRLTLVLLLLDKKPPWLLPVACILFLSLCLKYFARPLLTPSRSPSPYPASFLAIVKHYRPRRQCTASPQGLRLFPAVDFDSPWLVALPLVIFLTLEEVRHACSPKRCTRIEALCNCG